MELTFKQRQDFQHEERELEKAITKLAQRVKPANESERRQMQTWQKRLVEVRTQLGYVLSTSGRLLVQEGSEVRPKSTPARSTPSIQIADPSSALDLGKDMGAALRINIRPENSK
jgi:hypothetical protein